MSHFNNNVFQNPMKRYNTFLKLLSLSWPTKYKCGIFFPISLFAFFFSHSFQVALKVQKISRSIKKLIFNKMKKVSKEEVKRLS
jgi:hypothetical protein